MFYRAVNIPVVSKLQEFFHSLYFKSRNKMLLNKTVETRAADKISKYQWKKKLGSVSINTFSFPGRFPIIITTNKYQEQPPTIIEKFTRKQLSGRSVIPKKLIAHFDMNIFSRVVWILS